MRKPMFSARCTALAMLALLGTGVAVAQVTLAHAATAPAAPVQDQYTPPPPPPPAERVTLCDLYEHPEKYQGKVVQVYAAVSGLDLALEEIAATTSCPVTMHLKIALPAEHQIDLMDVETRADIKVLRHAWHPNQVALIAGRFNAAYRRKDGQRLPVEGGDPQGYGRQHNFDGILLLQSITELTVLPDKNR